MSHYDKYEPIIGLEVHIQLLTQSKAFSSDAAVYGDLPNTHVSPITLALPGTLPRHNKKAIEFAVKLGLAVNANIREYNEYARKNYFYADLPKGYQVTQDKTPICTGGHITIKLDGGEKKIGITRIHMEEDAGKSIHDQDPFDTLIDLNRAGVPLLEMVSEPHIHSGEEAYKYLTEVRKLVRYLDICDGNMEEGSLRCDANISVRLKGAKEFGRKVEVKNMNSIRNVQRAIEHEIKRQTDIIESGGTVSQDTRSFDAMSGTTFSLRSKEMANDYRYFPEPDLQPVVVMQDFIANVRSAMPPLPEELHKKYVSELGLPEYDAAVITEHKQFALYFEKLVEAIRHLPQQRGEKLGEELGIVENKRYKAAANWMMGPVKSYLNENAVDIVDFALKPLKIAELIQLVEEGKVSNTVAAQVIFPELIARPEKTPLEIAEEKNLVQQSDAGSLRALAEQAIAMYPEKVKEYKSGKVGLIGLFMGEVMKLSKGKADPKVANKIVKELLDKAE